MLQLNLIAKDLKKQIALRHIYNILKRIIFVLVVFTLFSFSVLFLAKNVLDNYFEEIVVKKVQDANNHTRYHDEIVLINKKVNAIKGIQDNFFSVQELLTITIKNSPQNIEIKSLKLNVEKQDVNLAGVASTREDLLSFKNYLEESELFTEVILPTDSLFKKENVSFSMQAKLLLN